MFKNLSKSKKIFIIICSSIIILSVAYGLYFFFWKNKNVEIQGLTEEQRATIIKELNSALEIVPITAKEREKITKELTPDPAITKPLTDEERNAILNALN